MFLLYQELLKIAVFVFLLPTYREEKRKMTSCHYEELATKIYSPTYVMRLLRRARNDNDTVIHKLSLRGMK